MQFHEKFGQLIMLMKTCIADIIPFSIYLFLYIFAVAMMYRILGHTGAAYKGIDDKNLLTFILMSWGNSIGNISELSFAENTPGLIIGGLYVVWILNQFFILVVMFNFLVAIVT